jgi:hypothetical protein
LSSLRILNVDLEDFNIFKTLDYLPRVFFPKQLIHDRTQRSMKILLTPLTSTKKASGDLQKKMFSYLIRFQKMFRLVNPFNLAVIIKQSPLSGWPVMPGQKAHLPCISFWEHVCAI